MYARLHARRGMRANEFKQHGPARQATFLPRGEPYVLIGVRKAHQQQLVHDV